MSLSQKPVIKSTHNTESMFYEMNNEHRALVLIYNHNKFVNPKYKPRNGTERDVDRLQSTLPKLGGM